jgi:hypothetical protein
MIPLLQVLLRKGWFTRNRIQQSECPGAIKNALKTCLFTRGLLEAQADFAALRHC